MSEQGESLEPIENVIAKKPEIVHEPAYYTFFVVDFKIPNYS